MKKLLCWLTPVIMFPAVGYSQNTSEEVDIYQSLFGMQKRAIVLEYTGISEEDDDEFWKLYDAYEVERKELGKERIELLNSYAENYSEMSDDKIKELVNASMKLATNSEKLIYKYFKKIEKASGANKAAQFFQLEKYFLTAVEAFVLENIPFIGEYSKN